MLDRHRLLTLGLLIVCSVSPSDGDNLLPRFTEPIPNVTVAVGRDVQLSCGVEGLGAYRAAWIKVETKAILTIHSHIITRNYRISLSHNDNRNFVLHIRNVQVSDGGGYMCQINTQPMMSQVGYVEILVPPDIRVDKSSSDTTVQEGANVTLRCQAEGYPAPNITWRREDNEPLSAFHGTSLDGETLVLQHVTRHQMAAYLCIASNGVPPSVSRRILLHVHFSPAVKVLSQMVGAPAGRDVTLDCQVESFPAAVNYWTREGAEILGSGAKYITASNERGYHSHMVLTVRKLTKDDFGAYNCVARNVLGSDQGSVKLYETVPPTPAAHLSVDVSSSIQRQPDVRRQQDEQLSTHKSALEDARALEDRSATAFSSTKSTTKQRQQLTPQHLNPSRSPRLGVGLCHLLVLVAGLVAR